MAASNGNERNLTLTARQDRVAALLASGSTVTRTAKECRVSTVTIYEWLKKPAFKERVAELRQTAVDRAIARLSELMGGQALDSLNRLLSDEETSASVRLDSVKAVFELFINTSNAAELKERLEKLEANQK
jgi:transposase